MGNATTNAFAIDYRAQTTINFTVTTIKILLKNAFWRLMLILEIMPWKHPRR